MGLNSDLGLAVGVVFGTVVVDYSDLPVVVVLKPYGGSLRQGLVVSVVVRIEEGAAGANPENYHGRLTVGFVGFADFEYAVVIADCVSVVAVVDFA